MKKYCLALSALILVASLCGCGSGNTAIKADFPVETWTDTGGDVSEYRTLATAFDIENGLLYAGFEEQVHVTGATEGRGVWKYDGAKWTDTGGAISEYYVNSLACDGVNNLVYANCYEKAPGELSGQEPKGAGVWKYDGKGWSDTGIPLDLFKRPGALAYDPVHDTLYASFFRGPNAGSVWKYDGKRWADTGGPGASSLACTGQTNLVYAATRSILKYDGTQWTDTGGDVSDSFVGCLTYNTGDGMLYARSYKDMFSGQGVWKYDGTTWTSTGGEISSHLVNSLACDPSRNVIYATCFENIFGRGVWKYDGNAWTDISGKMTDFYFGGLAYDSNNNVLYAGLYTNDGREGRGVWKYRVR